MKNKFPTITEFNERRELWFQCLSGKDPNSIANQLTRMMWNSAIWRFINECKKSTPTVNESEQILAKNRLNGMITRFIDDCFVETLLLNIRRLTDGYLIDSNPKTDVYSLISLLTDLIKHSKIITRENIFLSENREYDVEKAKEKFFALTSNNSSDFSSGFIPPDADFLMIGKRHEEIDFLCGVAPQNRSPNDSIKTSLLEELKSRLITASQLIRLYLNKYIAHPATPESRQLEQIDTLLWADLWKTQKLICQTTSFFNHYLFKQYVISYIPIPQFNQFEHLERPFVSENDLKNANEIWDKFINETKEWNKWDSPEFLKNL